MNVKEHKGVVYINTTPHPPAEKKMRADKFTVF